MDLAELKTRLRRVRLGMGIKAEEMAKVSGVSAATVRRYDNPADKSEPSLLTVARVCRHYGMSLDYLVFGETSREWDDEHKRFRAIWQHLDLVLTSEKKKAISDTVQVFMDLGIDSTKAVGDMRK